MMAQATRAVLFARATAATSLGFRLSRPSALFRKISKIDGRHVQVGPGSRNLNMVRPPETESVRSCPASATSIRRGADDPDPERGPVPLPAGGHLDADRHQLPRVSVPGQPEPRRA